MMTKSCGRTGTVGGVADDWGSLKVSESGSISGNIGKSAAHGCRWMQSVPAMRTDGQGSTAKSFQCGQYTVVREIGRGGMASVYEGEHAALGKRAAIKVMFPSLATSAT